jgi:hypothetical protein
MQQNATKPGYCCIIFLLRFPTFPFPYHFSPHFAAIPGEKCGLKYGMIFAYILYENCYTTF